MTQRRPSMPTQERAARTLRLGCLAMAAGLACGQPLQAQTGTETPARARTANAAAGHSPALKSRAPVTVNFVNAEVEAVTRAMATMIERQIALDPRVKGSMTLYSDQPLTVREAYLNYLSALRGLGFTMVENGGLLKVVPEAEAKLQTGTVSVGQPGVRGDQVITQIFQLNFESPNNLVAVLRPLISANNTINASLGNNSLVITDYADNLQRIAKIIAALDQPANTDTDVVTLKHAVASDLAPMVQRLAEGSGGAAAQPGLPSTGGAVTVMVDARSNSLILRAANPARLAVARSIIAKLDQPSQGGNAAGNIWVVYLKNADAVKLAAVLRAAFASGAGSGAATGVAGTGAPQPGRMADGAAGATP
ncbi:MAG: secretin N-terminal domain-containing protein, partial [Giesbergeria sp.]